MPYITVHKLTICPNPETLQPKALGAKTRKLMVPSPRVPLRRIASASRGARVEGQWSKPEPVPGFTV